MKKLYFRFGIALATFIVGSAAALCFRQAETASRESVASPRAPARPPPAAPPPLPPSPCSRVAASGRKLEAAEAVRVAECFIIRNGYTDLPPAEDESEITPEAVWPMTGEYGMRLRRDSLERRGMGYAKRPGGWLVVFRHKYNADRAGDMPNYEEWLETHGRAVFVDAYGRRLQVEHQGVMMNRLAFTKLPAEVQTEIERW